jgi:CubicO group peptidase (beta-lactamase class C family)
VIKLAERLTLLVLLLLTGASHRLRGQIRAVSGKMIGVAEMDQFLKATMDSLKIPGASIAIINDGRIIYERALGLANVDSARPVDAQTIFEAASMSKPVFSYFVFKMMQDGILSLALDQPVYEYFPYPDIAYDDRYKLITARMLLTHTSGFPNWRENNRLTIKFTPGTQYSYSGEGYEYLVNAVARLTHTNSSSLDSLLQATVVSPLGLRHFSYLRDPYLTAHKAYGYFAAPNPANGKFKPVPSFFGASYGLHTDAHDYAQFLIALMKAEGLRRPALDSLLRPRVRITEDGKPTTMYYAYGFVVDSTPFGVRYQHTGNNGNFTGGFMFFRQPQTGFVVLTNGDHGVLLDLQLARWLTYGTKR